MYDFSNLKNDKNIIWIFYIILFLFIGIGAISAKFSLFNLHIIISTGGHLFNLSIILLIFTIIYYKREFFTYLYKDKINILLFILLFYSFLTIIPLFFTKDLLKQEITYIFQDVLFNSIIFYYITDFLVYKNRERIKFIFYLLPFIGSIMIVKGVILNPKALLNINVYNLIEKGVEYHVAFSMILVMLIPLNIAILFKLDNLKYKLIYFLNLIILIFGLYLVYSRAGWISFIFIIILSLFIKEFSLKLRLYILLILILFLGVFLFIKPFRERINTVINYKKSGSIVDRVAIWKGALKAFIKKPLFGIGFSNAIFEKEKIYSESSGLITGKLLPHPHNLILQILVYTGVIGFILYLYIFYLFLKDFYREYKLISNNEKYIIFKLLILSFIAFFIINIVDTALSSPRAFLIFVYFLFLLKNFSTIFN